MLDFTVFSVTFVLLLIVFVIYLYQSSKNPSSVPGLDPVSKEDGNLGDIAKHGSLQEFLLDLHKQFGPIASFWWGPKYVVSIANDALFKEHQGVFDRPVYLFQLFEPLLGAKSILYTNGEDGRTRYNLYDECLTRDAIKKYYLTFQEIADDFAKKWGKMAKGEHIPLTQFTMAFALKAVLASLFGAQMKSDKKVLEFREHFYAVWTELEDSLKKPMSESSLKKVIDGTKKLSAVITELIEHRKSDPPQRGDELLLDLMLNYTNDNELQISDSLVFVNGGYQTSGNMLSWCFYYLATRGDIQEKVYEEIKTVLCDGDVDHSNISDLTYLRQVIDETLRCALIAPWAARFKDFDSELGGYNIPKNTPVIHALGVANKNEEVFPLPDSFDPDRFNPENKKSRSHLAFSPFGFAGKRVCPGQHFAYAEGAVVLVTLLRKFKVNLVEGQVIEPVYGLVTHPSDEIWITVSNR